MTTDGPTRDAAEAGTWMVRRSADAGAAGAADGGSPSALARFVSRAIFWPLVAKAGAEASTEGAEVKLAVTVAVHKNVTADGGSVGPAEIVVQLPKYAFAAGPLPSGWAGDEARWSPKHQQVMWRLPAATLTPGKPLLLVARLPLAAASPATVERCPVRMKVSLLGAAACRPVITAGDSRTAVEVSITSHIKAVFR